jgi:hypothetical protein
MTAEQSRRKGQKGNPHQVQIVQPKKSWVYMVQVMNQFVVRDPGNRTDQEADDIYRETGDQSQQCLDHSRIIDTCPDVFQVDVENEQGNGEGDDTVAERFDSALGDGAPPFKLGNRNSTHAHCMSWHGPRTQDYGALLLRAMYELGAEFD